MEVGVHKGEFSEHLLRHWRGRMLHLVDPWLSGGSYKLDRDANIKETLDRVAPFPGRYRLHRGYSTNVALVCGCSSKASCTSATRMLPEMAWPWGGRRAVFQLLFTT